MSSDRAAVGSGRGPVLQILTHLADFGDIAVLPVCMQCSCQAGGQLRAAEGSHFMCTWLTYLHNDVQTWSSGAEAYLNLSGHRPLPCWHQGDAAAACCQIQTMQCQHGLIICKAETCCNMLPQSCTRWEELHHDRFHPSFAPSRWRSHCMHMPCPAYSDMQVCHCRQCSCSSKRRIKTLSSLAG